jgi:hypothetical protein
MKHQNETSNIKNILFLDIETVSEFANYQDMSVTKQLLRSKKAAQIRKRSSECETLTDAEVYAERA